MLREWPYLALKSNLAETTFEKESTNGFPRYQRLGWPRRLRRLEIIARKEDTEISRTSSAGPCTCVRFYLSVVWRTRIVRTHDYGRLLVVERQTMVPVFIPPDVTLISS